MASAAPAPSFFDRWSATYDRPDFQRFTYRPLHNAVVDRLGSELPSTVLDLGCGTGKLTRRLARQFPQAAVIGVDLSRGMLARAAASAPVDGPSPALLMRVDAENLPFAPASIDIVTCTESFHWYRHQGRALEGLAKVLREGGRLLIASIATFTPVGERVMRRATRLAGNQVKALPPHQLRVLLERAGFEVTHQQRIPRPGPWPVLTDAVRR